MIDHSIQCPECRAYGGGHSPFCSQQTPEQIKDQLKVYYDAWLKLGKEQAANRTRWVSQGIFWQAKFTMLKHENNKLRSKLRKAGVIK